MPSTIAKDICISGIQGWVSNMQSKIYIFLVCILLSSCAALPESFREGVLQPMNLWKPRPPGLAEAPVEGVSPEYTQGWKDGCDSGISAAGSTHYRQTGYKFVMDYSMVENKDYYQAWHDAYTYCRWYVGSWNTSGEASWVF